MKGTFRLYSDGELIHEGQNLITTNGKIAIQRYLAGITGHFGKSIRLGIGSTAANVANTALECETAYAGVYLISPDYTNTALIFKGRLDETAVMSIYEMGLSTAIPAPGAVNGSRVLLAFESSSESWTGAGVTVQTSGMRFGVDSLRLTAAASTTTTATLIDLGMDLSVYSDSDEFKLAYNPTTAFTSTVQLRLLTDASNYYTYTINTPASGFKVATINKTSFTATGSPSWASITQAQVLTTATAGGSSIVDFEALRVDDKDTFTESEILVSRYVPGSPVAKVSGQPLDIEYTIDLTI